MQNFSKTSELYEKSIPGQGSRTSAVYNDAIAAGNGIRDDDVKDLYFRFVILRNFLECLKIIYAWSYVTNKYTNESLNKIQQVKSISKRLHGEFVSKRYREPDFDLRSYYQALRINGSTVISSLDRNYEAFSLIERLFSRFSMSKSKYFS